MSDLSWQAECQITVTAMVIECRKIRHVEFDFKTVSRFINVTFDR